MPRLAAARVEELPCWQFCLSTNDIYCRDVEGKKDYEQVFPEGFDDCREKPNEEGFDGVCERRLMRSLDRRFQARHLCFPSVSHRVGLVVEYYLEKAK